MSVLSDGTIRELIERGRIRIDPWDPALVQPASVDLRLGDSFRVFHNHRAPAIDLREPPGNLTEEVAVGPSDSFVIHPGEFCLGRTLEWVELPDDIVARIEGKALAVDTPVPSPDGWRTIGELEPGDWVFDINGHPTPVLAVSETFAGRPCRAVEFSDGTTIVADIDHHWQVWTRYDRSRRGRPRVATTVEIERTLTENGYEVAQARAVYYPSRRLPCDPYELGASLAADSGGWQRNGTMGTRFSASLELLGLRDNEHIPREYLESSVEQRQALLEGIMDAEGDIDVNCRCEVTTTSRRIAGDYRQLIASLGHGSVVDVSPDCGTRYEVKFTPHSYVFRLPRKLARQKLLQRFHIGRAITAVRECESVPVRCIQVGSADGVFLVSRSFIPTHNSSLGRLGLIVHATAGFCDPGWKGTLTLELNNLTRVPIKLYPGLLIAQLSFMTLDRAAQRPYGSPELGSHYQGQMAATESRYEGDRAGASGQPIR
jgi:deoxycytidine triphosphate deaminase